MISYLSGAMEQAPEEGQEWRSEITDWLKCELGHRVLNPVLMSRETAKLENAKNYRDWKLDHPEKFKSFIRKIIRSDINAVVSEADYLICLWDKFVIKGGGTHAEVTFAYWYKKPVYLINNLEAYPLSSWIEACSDYVFNDFKSLKKTLIDLYG